MNAIVIEGGGSKGAYTAGRLCELRKHYDIAVGSSTGALIAPFALTADWETLEKAYTTISNRDVYSRYPFYKNIKGIPNIQLALWSWIRNKKGITDSEPLRELIRKCFTVRHYDLITQQEKQLFVTVCELNKTKNAAKYISIYDYTYAEFCDFIWASTLVPALFEPLIKTNSDGTTIEYCDGGTVENVGLKKALEIGAKNVDVYMHSEPINNTDLYKSVGANWVQNLIRALVIQRQEVIDSDLYIGKDEVDIQVYFMQRKLQGAGIMDFEPEIMSEWFRLGKLDR